METVCNRGRCHDSVMEVLDEFWISVPLFLDSVLRNEIDNKFFVNTFTAVLSSSSRIFLYILFLNCFSFLTLAITFFTE